MNRGNPSIDGLRGEDGGLDRDAIGRILPYREPFLFVDKVVRLSSGEIEAEKRIDPSMEFLEGHFVGFPVMPATLIAEGFGQAGTILVRYNLDDHEAKEILACRIEDARFHSPAYPGETLTYRARLGTMDGRAARPEGEVSAGGRKVATFRVMVAIVERRAFRRGRGEE